MVKILTLISILIIISCSEKNREEITERYDNGNKKLLVKYKGDKGEEVILEKIEFFVEGDTLNWENYNINGKKGKWTSYNENLRFFFNIADAVRRPEKSALVTPTVTTSCPVRYKFLILYDLLLYIFLLSLFIFFL